MITTEIKTEIIMHPELGAISKDFIYTYLDGVQISKEFLQLTK